MKYRVTFSIDATISVEVDAESSEQAKQKALEEVETPCLCHHCASQVDIGDIIEAYVWLEGK